MTANVKLCLIVARGRSGVIGAKGDLPWRLKDDLAFFKKITFGCPVVMGRNTWESLPVKPLPGRENLVLTSDWTYEAMGARVYASFAAAVNTAKAIALRSGFDKVFIIGGASVYERALAQADRLYLTEVDAAPDGDVFFPEIDDSEWEEVSAETHSADDRNDHAFVIRQLDRRS